MTHTLDVFEAEARVLVDREKCDLCGMCWENCPTEAIILREGILEIVQEKCIACYVCVILCDRGALEIVWAYKPFHGKSGVSFKRR